MLRFAKIMIILAFIVVFFAAISLGFLTILSGGDPVGYLRAEYLRFQVANRQEDLERSVSDDSTEQLFRIESGDTPISVALKLAEQNLVVDSELFVDYMVVEDLDVKVQEGAFFLSPAMNIIEIANTITDRNNAGILFVILPGQRIEEIAENIDQISRLQFTGLDFLNLVNAGAQIDPTISERLGIPVGASLEGFMFPDTYILSQKTSALDFRNIVIQNFLDSVPEGYYTSAQEQDFSMREIVTLASIVEREAVWDDEHAMIASVYRNRLDIGMMLEADPTVQYGLGYSRGVWWANITQADYRDVVSPYNTYLNFGLPPSPISSPSLSAIEATLYPEESPYYYFRAKCDGSHYHEFAETFEEHVANGC